MLPILSDRPTTNPACEQLLLALSASGFEGEIERSAASRLAVATDNSVYQIMPDAVVFPRSGEDVVRLMRLLGSPAHRSVSVVARAGGTGTNGQALNSGIVVDCSRHMTKIIELNAEERWVRLEPGVVLDDLNRHVKSAGLFFGPTLSPSNRATLGGMISTNASGKGSRVYGRTADHVLELDVVLLDGTRITTRDLKLGEARLLANRPDREGRLYATLLETLERHREEIANRWPKMPRTLTGYDLQSACRRHGDEVLVSLNPILAGSEGTLGFIVGARLRLLPIPRAKRTIALAYAQFDHALAAAESLVSANPTAIETIDHRILSLARADTIWHEVEHLLSFNVEVEAINLLEFSGDDSREITHVIERLVSEFTDTSTAPGAPVGVVVAQSERDATALWELRKKGVGLLGALKGERRPIPFVEDTAVPPARLAQYVREFRKLLDDAGLVYGMFGHVDVGCLHVRPALNLRDPCDEARLRQISDRVLELVKRYGGVFWGEHGKGFRSEYVPEFFGKDLFDALCTIKAAFDPRCQLNPGKLAIVRGSDQRLANVDAPKRGSLDRHIAPAAQRHFDVAIHCNGNAQCLTSDPNTVMCPSSKQRRDRVHSPKGRAGLLREWLRQLSMRGFDAGAHLQNPQPSAHWLETMGERRRSQEYDFSHEVYDGLDGCLSCKACATQCPIQVDIPRMKAGFLWLYHQRYARPIRDYFVAALEWILVVLAVLPRFFNWWMQRGWIRSAMRRWVGIVDIPALSTINLTRELRRRRATWLTQRLLRDLLAQPTRERVDRVILLQDAFTTFYEPEVALAAYDLMVKMGNKPLVVPYFPNGKALVIKGFLGAFRVVARRNARRLNELAQLGIPMVGIEPAVALTYRDEYEDLLGKDSVRFRIELLQDWLDTQRDRIAQLAKARSADAAADGAARPLLLGHCTERTAAPASQNSWQRVFAAAGIELEPANVGCCGMCGVFGHEAAHADESKGVYAMSWQPRLRATTAQGRPVLVTGHSCRSQVHRCEGLRLRHPVELLSEALDGRTSPPCSRLDLDRR